MNTINTLHSLQSLTHHFNSCSLVNAEGTLIWSRDQDLACLSTTRLVAFQIVRKYLRPQAQDLFILNDPENGGYQLSRPLFISGLSSNLFLIWDIALPLINFKIPPTPLYDQGVKNEFAWKAMIESHPSAKDFKSQILRQKQLIDQTSKLKEVIQHLSDDKNQQLWLKTSQQAFDILFSQKATGSAESFFKLNQTQTIKLKLTIEERQNLKLIQLDFSNTSLAQDVHAASHVIEGALIHSIVTYYDLKDYFTQTILDKIKMILPPRSIVAKSHPQGHYNYDLQSICTQLCQHNVNQLNTPSRKGLAQFQYKDFVFFGLGPSPHECSLNYVSPERFEICSIEQLANQNLIEINAMKRADTSGLLSFTVTQSHALTLQFHSLLKVPNAAIHLTLNKKPCPVATEPLILKAQDHFQMEWTF